MMDDFGSIKTPQNAIMTTAVVVVGLTSAHFNNRINQLEKDLEEIKQHLSSVILNDNSRNNSQVSQAIQAIKVLDNRTSQMQENFQHLAKSSGQFSSIGDSCGLERPKYERLTPTSLGKNSKSSGLESELESYDFEVQENTDEDDIKAMME